MVVLDVDRSVDCGSTCVVRILDCVVGSVDCSSRWC